MNQPINKPDGTGPWDNPGVTPDGRRTRMANDGPRIPSGDEAEVPPIDPRAGVGHANPRPNRQGGVVLAEGVDEAGVVATGDRRDEVHYEDDPDQIVRVVHEVKPVGPLPTDEQRGRDHDDQSAAAPVQEVGVSPSKASAWDARPTRRA